jgi:ankyrin repeat protein
VNSWDILQMGWTPFMWAVYKNHPQIVSYLLEHDAHVNLIDEEDGLTPLMAAAGRGFDQVVPILINAGAEVNATDKVSPTFSSAADCFSFCFSLATHR